MRGRTELGTASDGSSGRDEQSQKKRLEYRAMYRLEYRVPADDKR